MVCTGIQGGPWPDPWVVHGQIQVQMARSTGSRRGGGDRVPSGMLGCCTSTVHRPATPAGVHHGSRSAASHTADHGGYGHCHAQPTLADIDVSDNHSLRSTMRAKCDVVRSQMYHNVVLGLWEPIPRRVMTVACRSVL